MNARPITWPTVPRGKDRVRVCLHAGNTREEVDRLVEAIMGWAGEIVALRRGEARKRINKKAGQAVKVLMEAKL